MEDPATGNKIINGIRRVVFQGEQLKSRNQESLQWFSCVFVPHVRTSHADREDMVKGVRTRLEDLNLY